MTDAELCRVLLSVVAAIPSPVKWHVAALHDVGLLLLADDRDEATASVIEAVATQAGEVLTIQSLDATPSTRPLLGCLIRPPVALGESAEALRAAYQATIGESA